MPKIKIYIQSLLIIIGSIMIFVSGCSEKMDVDLVPSEYITYSIDQSEETKVTLMNQLEGDAMVYGYLYDNWSETLTPWNKISDADFSFDGDKLTSNTNIAWKEIEKEPNRAYFKTFAFAPKEVEGASVATTGTPKITYTIPSDLNKQVDLVTASMEVGGDFKSSIPLNFKHVLTALEFKIPFATASIESIVIDGVYNKGIYTFEQGWTIDENSKGIFTITDPTATVMMIPQTVPAGATITLNYDGGEKIKTSLENIEWNGGKRITYTLHKTETKTYIYFDLAAGNVSINSSTYSGSKYVNGTKTTVTGTHLPENEYYVYQTSSTNRPASGPPTYEPAYIMEGDTKILWSNFIINNNNVNKVIEAWDNKTGATDNTGINNTKAVRRVGRESTKNRITVTGDVGNVNLTIDNIYSTYHESGSEGGFDRYRDKGGIAFNPSSASGSRDSQLKLNIIGDNRLGCIHYSNQSTTKNSLTFEGTGSLTVADADFYKATNNNVNGYYANRSCAVIGSADYQASNTSKDDHAYNIIINSGNIYAGATKAELSTPIGGGGNGNSTIIIKGGTITAVASGTGSAIGGGTGLSQKGGEGVVNIEGGNVYAYNLENSYGIPSAAIGGGGSRDAVGSKGTVNISGGNIYAFSIAGTAIGGGSSKTKNGGSAEVKITGGNIIAISKAGTISGSKTAGAGIGGGTGGSDSGSDGGSAIIKISGNPIIRTGSIGGGKRNNSSGDIGTADIEISGGDIQAQFVMAAGAAVKPKFKMGGDALIRNSSTTDDEYLHIEELGGAIYLEDGTFMMEGGTIRNCSAQKGGAIYIKGSTDTKFEMTGGSILECTSQTDGGALYMEGGQVILSGGTISKNVASMGNGGAISILGGDFSMPETGTATISQNAAFIRNNTGGDGGGIYVTSTSTTHDVKVEILSGSITNNSSDRRGGGLCVDMAKNQKINANVTVGADGSKSKTNPLITTNTALIQGGGLYVKGATANITINGGKILGNTTTGYVANPDVANELGMVTLNGGDVTHVTITFDGNGGNLKGNQAVTATSQDIVTATKSLVTRPEFERLGYTFLEWNTRPDGKGTTPPVDNIMNTSSNITYFAIWIPGVGN